MNDWNEFNKSKDSIGEPVEQVWACCMCAMGYRMEHNDNYKYDYWTTSPKGKVKKVEIKSDQKAEYTGNLAFEYESYGKPSGFCSTESDYWVIYYSGVYHWLYTCDIRKIIHNGAVNGFETGYDAMRNGGTNKETRMYVIAESKVAPFYTYQMKVTEEDKNKLKNIQ